jgi:hypothetical protein
MAGGGRILVRATRDDAGGRARCNRIIRNVTQNPCARTDQHVIPDMNRPEKLSAGSDVDVIANHRCASLLDAPETNNNTIANAAIITELSVTTNNDSTKVVDDKTAAYSDLAR